jgi:hypothetical protein
MTCIIVGVWLVFVLSSAKLWAIGVTVTRKTGERKQPVVV